LQSGKQTSEFYEDLWKTILSGNGWHGEFQNKKKNGDYYWESAVISSIMNNQGDIAFFFAIKEDITEKKKIVEDLIKTKEKAEESDRLKSAFLSNISHEIRTPMNGILGFTDVFKDPDLSHKERQEYICIVENSITRLLNIINDIMVISKIETKPIQIFASEINVNEQIESVYTFFKPQIEQKGIQISFKNALPPKEAIIKTDREKIDVVLTNLVKNAVKFTQAGSIEFGYKKKGEYLEFFVKDTGVGIHQEQMEIIFERFRQGNESLTRYYEGIGLGLSISKAYVEMLGGKIWAESEVGKGSTFLFTIPYFKTHPSQSNDNHLRISKQVNRV
jgi:signal transduction histidine kinase